MFLEEPTLGKFKQQEIVDALKDFIKGEKAKAWFIYSGEAEDGSDTDYEDISRWDQSKSCATARGGPCRTT